MDGKYVANRPISVTKSTWDQRVDEQATKKRSKDKDGNWNLARMGKRQRGRHITSLLSVQNTFDDL